MAALAPEFPKKPAMQALLNEMMSVLVSRGDINELLKNRKTVYGWILSQGWKDIQGAMLSSGLMDEYKACVLGKNEVGVQACFAEYEAKLVAWAVVEYLREAGADPVAYTAAGEGGALVDESKGMSAGTMMAIGAGVILLGGVGYYAYTRSKSKSNPSKGPRLGPWGGSPAHLGDTWLESERDGRRRARVRFPDDSLRIVDCAGVADTYFSISARARIAGKTVTGYVTVDENRSEFVFRPVNTDKDLLASLLKSKRNPTARSRR